jgi:hypothetical protein
MQQHSKQIDAFLFNGSISGPHPNLLSSIRRTLAQLSAL